MARIVRMDDFWGISNSNSQSKLPLSLIGNWNTRQGCRDEMRSISRGKARQRSRRSRQLKNAGRIFELEIE
jgi:hypothetical protein